MKCNECGTNNPDEAEFCQECGKRINSKTIKYDVFISYSIKDKNIADAVCASFENKNIRCWIAPRDIQPGADWGGSIVKAIHDSKIMVLIFSSESNQSPQVLREVERAVSNGNPIIPFRIEDIEPTKSMEYFISATHWLDALTPPLERHIQKLTKLIEKILSQDEGDELVKKWTPAPKKPQKPSKIRKILNYIALVFGIVVVLMAIYGYFVNIGIDNTLHIILRSLILFSALFLIFLILLTIFKLPKKLGRIGNFLREYKTILKGLSILLIIFIFFPYVGNPYVYNQNGIYLETNAAWYLAPTTEGAMVSFKNGNTTTIDVFNSSGNLTVEFEKQYSEYSGTPGVYQNLTEISNSTNRSSLRYSQGSSVFEEVWIQKNYTIYIFKFKGDQSYYNQYGMDQFYKTINSFRVT